MKKLLLIPSLALTAITPVIAMTSCNKDNEKKNGIVWDKPYGINEEFHVVSNKLDGTWLFDAEGSDIQCISSGDDTIELKISYESLKSGISRFPATVDCNFSILIHGETISYQWGFSIYETFEDSIAYKPKIRN